MYKMAKVPKLAVWLQLCGPGGLSQCCQVCGYIPSLRYVLPSSHQSETSLAADTALHSNMAAL